MQFIMKLQMHNVHTLRKKGTKLGWYPFKRYNKVQRCTFSFCTLGYCPVPYFFCMLTFWKFPFLETFY